MTSKDEKVRKKIMFIVSYEEKKSIIISMSIGEQITKFKCMEITTKLLLLNGFNKWLLN